ncbi:hypothetical protein LJK88_24260 [Paenibacillus sp. P26]|nr:hypothetical protein LJK88_24260 [Paenibacillus sp. P26]UUZ95409.1 hypothetical protein LJK87_13640 [Paenibacillus sp. P25]
MLGVIGIVSASIVIAIIEIPSLLERKLRKELWVFSLLLLMGTALSCAKMLGANLPNPSDWLTVVLKPVSDALFQLLK